MSSTWSSGYLFRPLAVSHSLPVLVSSRAKEKKREKREEEKIAGKKGKKREKKKEKIEKKKEKNPEKKERKKKAKTNRRGESDPTAPTDVYTTIYIQYIASFAPSSPHKARLPPGHRPRRRTGSTSTNYPAAATVLHRSAAASAQHISSAS